MMMACKIMSTAPHPDTPTPNLHPSAAQWLDTDRETINESQRSSESYEHGGADGARASSRTALSFSDRTATRK